MSYQNGIIHHLIRNRLEIFFPDNEMTTITEENIVSESMTLRQRLCDGDTLRFGGCIASEFSVKLMNTAERQFSTELAGKWISVKMTQYYADPDEALCPSASLLPSDTRYPSLKTEEKAFWIFSGYIDSAQRDKSDNNVFTLVAYDVMAKLHAEDFTDWLYDFWYYTGDKSISTVLSFCLRLDNGFVIPSSGLNSVFTRERVSFVDSARHMLDQNPYPAQAYYAVNTAWKNSREKISKGMAAKYICEIFGVFGFVQPNSEKGEFVMRSLSGTPEVYRFYEELHTEDYQSTGYTDFLFSVAESPKGKNTKSLAGLSDMYDGAVAKAYDFSKNIFLWEKYVADGEGRTSTDVDVLINNTSIGTRLALNAESTAYSGQCAFSTFQPLTATLDGRLWVPVGTPAEILVNRTTVDGDYVLDEHGKIIKDTVKTYVLSRTLTGIQALTDKIEAKGAA